MAQWNKAEQAYRAQDTTNFEVYMCADKYGNIGACGGDTQFDINVASGINTQMANVHKFGAVLTTSADYDTVWTVGGAYAFPSTAGIVTATSTSTEDAAGQTGALTVRLQGLDANYNEVEEDFTLNGTVGVAGTVSFLRTHRAFVLTGNNDNNNVGNINFTHQPTSNTVCQIAAAMGQSQVTFYTIPAGKSGYLRAFAATMNKNQENTVRLFQKKPDGGVFRLASELNLYSSNMHTTYSIPLYFTEKTDLEVRTYTGSNCTVSSMFDLLVVDN
jgi:hypothetical protein